MHPKVRKDRQLVEKLNSLDPLALRSDLDPLALTPHNKSNTNKRHLDVTPPSAQNKSKKFKLRTMMENAGTDEKLNVVISSLANLTD